MQKKIIAFLGKKKKKRHIAKKDCAWMKINATPEKHTDKRKHD